MPDDLDTELPQPDLAQLLVLEAGRILENLTPDLATRLPDLQTERYKAIGSALATLDKARMLMTAAVNCSAPDSTG